MANPPKPDLKAIFSEALEYPAGPERSAYLDRACQENPHLYLQVEGLLAAHHESRCDEPTRDADSPDQRPESDERADPHSLAITEGPGTVIGPYKLLQKIGEGGMGAVFMAEQEKPVRRKVALKVIKPGMDTGQVIARFEAERQALAIMEHPHIARVLDAGGTATGRPFFVMELVKGVPITEYCDRNHLTPKERLELFIPICHAIQHAHQKGIIHRDIKPSNILVTLHDGNAIPKVIDFGVAKAIDQYLTEKTMFTEFGAVIGTLEYMSPEQAEMGALDIDTRSDIYSLGVLLYELLTGSTPLERAKIRKAASSDVLRRIREEEPAKPSTRLSDSKDALPSISAQRKMEPARLTKLVRGDLDWIVMKSLEKDRTRRYETATGFARDVRRYLDGDPVEACPPSASYKLKKFARKHRAALTTTGAFALILVAASVVSVSLALWANQQRLRARMAEIAAKEQKTRAEEREQLAVDAVRQYSDIVRDTPELKNTASLARLRATLLKQPQTFFKRLLDQLQADRETTNASLARLATANFDLGQVTREIGDYEDALRAFEQSLAIRERLASDDLAQTQLALAYSHSGIAEVQRGTGRLSEALASDERARMILERLVAANPSSAEFRADLAKTLNNIGVGLNALDRPTEALAAHERALVIVERLAKENPSRIPFQSNLARLLSGIGTVQDRLARPADALTTYERAHAIHERLARENPSVAEYRRVLAVSYTNIGLMRNAKGQRTEALVSHEKARTIREGLVREDPSVLQFQSELAHTHNNVAALYSYTGKHDAALASYELARAINERLAKEHPSAIDFQTGLASTLFSMGVVKRQTNRIAEALPYSEQALAIRERLAKEYPSSMAFQSNSASSYNETGILLAAMGRSTEAIASYERARAIQEQFARKHPESADLASKLGGTLNNIATQYLKVLQYEKTRDTILQAIEWQRKALVIRPAHPTYRLFLTNHLKNLMIATQALGRSEEVARARREYDELRSLDPKIIALDARLSAVLKGQVRIENTERLQLASHAYDSAMYAASAQLYAEALANNPALVDDRVAQHAYMAARCALLAATGEGKNDPTLDDDAKAKLHRQALDWLKAELAAWDKAIDSSSSEARVKITPMLKYWKIDTYLACIRDEKQLSKLAEAERKLCQEIWTEIDRLLFKTAETK